MRQLERWRAQFLRLRACIGGGWRAAREGKTHYAPTNRIPELGEALARKAHGGCGLDYDTNCEILIKVGGAQLILQSFYGLLNQGNEVLIPDTRFAVHGPSIVRGRHSCSHSLA
jgi:N-succinyldiaminopimelate aminotransferase